MWHLGLPIHDGRLVPPVGHEPARDYLSPVLASFPQSTEKSE